MEIVTDATATNLPACVATIGCFDGVHRGHRYLIEQVHNIAKAEGLASCLITFTRHPRQVLDANYQPRLLTCLSQKIECFEHTPIEYCVLLPFTKELSLLSAREFMEILHNVYHVQTLFVGYDHHFGHDQGEGYQEYCRYGKELGMRVMQSKALVEEGVSISSTLIRSCLQDGQVKQANSYLGYSYYLNGRVVDGRKLGRTLGFPTANIQPLCAEKQLPVSGVYAVYVYLGKERYAGMLNIGSCPTVNDDNQAVSIEVHILNFLGDIYEELIKVEFVDYIRPEVKFDNVEELTQQLQRDRVAVKNLLNQKD
ncbi:MAG TPA: riboflavin biosynthesis protein RibF [Bacteroides mediterraneensis]|uniref:riboflavin biosynthesis protein RibF n=1 Tax=Bacteroides mediterraneensis TaxID=1841856 RepID=UPI0026102540|nr:riboflavin biosynthesis protein RibF [Bacteroides mediterraneensis]HJH66056.1 riboflavin biosynthesis protein RibF [Bacteroides mediterraneensis]